MPPQPGISSWMTMDNPQGGYDDCLDAIGTYAEVGNGDGSGDDGSVNDGSCSDAHPLSCAPSHTNTACPSYHLSSPPPHSDAREALDELHQPEMCMPNPMDPDENDVGPGEELLHPTSRQEQRRQQRRTNKSDSGATVRNDANKGHLPLQVENEIDELGKFLSLMQPQDVARAHDFGPTLEEYAVNGVPVDCGEHWRHRLCEEIQDASVTA